MVALVATAPRRGRLDREQGHPSRPPRQPADGGAPPDRLGLRPGADQPQHRHVRRRRGGVRRRAPCRWRRIRVVELRSLRPARTRNSLATDASNGYEITGAEEQYRARSTWPRGDFLASFPAPQPRDRPDRSRRAAPGGAHQHPDPGVLVHRQRAPTAGWLASREAREGGVRNLLGQSPTEGSDRVYQPPRWTPRRRGGEGGPPERLAGLAPGGRWRPPRSDGRRLAPPTRPAPGPRCG